MTHPVDYAHRERSRFYDELWDFLRIPSVSAKSEHNGDTERAAEWVRAQLAQAGLRTETIATPGHPVVLGEWREAGPDAPTVLIYGHYDVQPPEPLDLWDSPPFEPAIRDGRIYARGSADDKGQLFLHIKALEAHLATRGRLPVNVVVLAEGEEEVGSPNLVPFVKAHRERLAAETVVISDSAMFAPGIPSLLFSLRGLAYFEIHAEGPRSDLHSGAYGGAIPNPANALARVISTLHDETGRIAIEGFYDDIEPPVPRDARRDPVASLRRRSLCSPGGHHSRGWRIRLFAAGTAVDPPFVRRERHALRLHGRRRQDRASRQGDGEGQLPPGSGPVAGSGEGAS